METELIMGYILYADGKAVSVGRTLDEAQAAAGQYLSQTAKLQIQSAVAPAPTRTWNYDYTIQQWVEFIRAS
jgi:hypothetical protein